MFLWWTFSLLCEWSYSVINPQTQGYLHHLLFPPPHHHVMIKPSPLSFTVHIKMLMFREEQAKHAWNNRDRSLNIFVKEDCVFTFHRWQSQSLSLFIGDNHFHFSQMNITFTFHRWTSLSLFIGENHISNVKELSLSQTIFWSWSDCLFQSFQASSGPIYWLYPWQARLHWRASSDRWQ